MYGFVQQVQMKKRPAADDTEHQTSKAIPSAAAAPPCDLGHGARAMGRPTGEGERRLKLWRDGDFPGSVFFHL
ncbi:hypothetical protein DPMN_098029 [Dreissena polymorpha]|uniref:Uncharacterized protein n=1 Tax=Dreissena polymorpha TaxID=45954 RepID=A0A9D4LDY4_DREPO|nr:hypothetical protein DPMN_098029 [Dreissena polymorpha]